MHASRGGYILQKDNELCRKTFLDLSLNDMVSDIKVTCNEHGVRIIKCQATLYDNSF